MVKKESWKYQSICFIECAGVLGKERAIIIKKSNVQCMGNNKIEGLSEDLKDN